MFALPRGGPWDIRLTRLTADSTVVELQNDLHWDSYTEIIDDRVNYTLSACVGITIDAEQFRSIPKRTYLVDGLYIRVPTNYDPVNKTYSGTWNGAFKLAVSSNPAWVLYDLITNNRYGLGRFININMIDKWSFYTVGVWCDGRVPDMHGGYEPRYSCNVQITNQAEAFDLVAQLAGVFRGFVYWNGSQMIAVTDQVRDPVYQYTNANVIDGQFTYTGTDLRSRHSMAAVTWNDPSQLGEQRISVVEDQPAISRFGIQKVDVDGVGIIDETQALRLGKWQIYTEQYEGEMIQFTTGHEGAWARPGDIIRVMDGLISGKRRGGRVGQGSTTTQVVFDAPVWLDAMRPYQLSCVINGIVETHPAGTGQITPGEYDRITTLAFSAPPQPDTVWVLNDPGQLEPTLWRTIGMRQTAPDQNEITAMRHLPGKWDYVEKNLPLTIPDVTDISIKPGPVLNLTVSEYLVATSPVSVGVRATLSWRSTAPLFEVWWRNTDKHENWSRIRVDGQAADVAVTEGMNTFQVTPISTLGLKGTPVSRNQQIIGRFAPPAAPRQFRIKISDGIALFQWLPATEIDVIIAGHFELRQSAQTSGAIWSTAQVVIPSIPGTATSVETVYRTGTWFLRTFDIVGTPSATAAVVIALQPDGRYNEFARICENPDYLGTHNFTEVMMPQDWLVLGQTGGLWDDQMANMDDWPTVDVLAENAPDPPESEPRTGWYDFENRIDAGGIFAIRFTSDILAFPFASPDEFIDSRLNNVDDWNDWDDVNEDLGGEVQLYIRTTEQDPASPTAVWSDWQLFSPVEYTARGFEFRAVLSAPAGQNIGVETMCITADLRMKMDSAEDVSYPATTTHVTFKVKFYMVPSVVVTVQNALATDTIQVINKTREGFDLNVTNAGAQVTRTFDWQARGF
jgi:predicted phage tail protein